MIGIIGLFVATLKSVGTILQQLKTLSELGHVPGHMHATISMYAGRKHLKHLLHCGNYYYVID